MRRIFLPANRGAKSKANLIEYVESHADRKLKKSGGDKRGTSMSYIALNHHLKEYSGDKTIFKQIDKNYCQGFVEYLKTAVNANNGQRLSANTQWGYMKRLEAVFNSAISDEIADSNSFKQIKPVNKPKKLSLEVPIETVSKILGHPDIKTTQIYAKVIDKSKRDAVDKLDGLVV